MYANPTSQRVASPCLQNQDEAPFSSAERGRTCSRPPPLLPESMGLPVTRFFPPFMLFSSDCGGGG
jgi:hypothetical protein